MTDPKTIGLNPFETAAMSTKITDAMIREAYRVARKVFDGELRDSKEVETLVESSGFNKNSAKHAVANLGHMLNGRVYMMVNNLAMTEYFLEPVMHLTGVVGVK